MALGPDLLAWVNARTSTIVEVTLVDRKASVSTCRQTKGDTVAVSEIGTLANAIQASSCVGIGVPRRECAATLMIAGAVVEVESAKIL